MAILLSFVIPGLGQLYQGRNNDAIWQFLTWIFGLITCIGAPVAIGVWVYSMFDAYQYSKSGEVNEQ